MDRDLRKARDKRTGDKRPGTRDKWRNREKGQKAILGIEETRSFNSTIIS